MVVVTVDIFTVAIPAIRVYDAGNIVVLLLSGGFIVFLFISNSTLLETHQQRLHLRHRYEALMTPII